MSGRSLWRRPEFWLAAAVLTRHTIGALNLRSTLKLATVARLADGDGVPTIPIHVVIPVLREQPHIRPALEWFVPLLDQFSGSTLTIVSTGREQREREHMIRLLTGCHAQSITPVRFPQLRDAELHDLVDAAVKTQRGVLTEAAARNVLQRFPLTAHVVEEELDRLLRPAHVRHVQFDGDGRKAAQVNHAAASLGSDAVGYFAVYDVDSRPSESLMRRTLAFIAERASADGQLPAVVQQSARFTTAGTGPSWADRALCRGAARVQTLWTLRREVPSFRRFAWATRRVTGVPLLDAAMRGLAQTVGHGLLVRCDVFARLGGLPTYTVLDDLPFGYRLTVEGIPVDCVPGLAVADAPEDVRDLIAQGRRWFQNYLDYPRCAARARADAVGTTAEHAAMLTVAAYRGLAWLAAGPATAACLVLAAGRFRPPVRVLAAAALWLGTVTPVRMLAGAEGRHLTVRQQAGESIEVLAAYLLRSTGPIAAVADRITRGDGALSPKTNRRNTTVPPSEEDSRDHRD
ncbi:glycosyltransferase family 2 protein [Solwaraspora sp. WMMD791]|uniref:glycosyltransferase family 2 protein n=1 Tax=Solwaraspora sp. WMMD791 TaxID=3016086 RepID=UPI00249CD01E|nr:glycosyltransferase family 2 protein [Solwaraspora sp. WMMD791]WFE26189.1 glycosyltransferase family 2 protein [Solwaraspora sp. WMMD791]